MSSRKVFKATVNYAELLNRVPPEQAHHLKILVSKNKQYKEKLQELPEEMPKINWDYYKLNVRPEFSSMVEEFEKKYNELQVPYPEDPYESDFEAMRKEVECEIEEYITQSNCRIEQIQERICEIQSQIPFVDMTMEEFCIAYPDIAPDFINRPTFWPHTKDEQLPTPEEIAEIKRKAEEEEKAKKAAEEEKAKLKAVEAKETKEAVEAKGAKEAKEEKAAKEAKEEKAAKDSKEATKDEKDTPDKTEKK